MIIPVFAIQSLKEYENKKDIEFKPSVCPACQSRDSFWKHGTYKRIAIEDGRRVEIRVRRFLCRQCRRAVTCLFGFLVPYSQFTTSVISKSVETYACSETTYSALAEEMSELQSEMAPKPSSAQIFRWVSALARKAAVLKFSIQKEMTMRSKIALLEHCETLCTEKRAKSAEKRSLLRELGTLVFWAQQFPGEGLSNLHAFFLSEVESLQAIFSGHALKLPTPHNLKYSIF